MKTVEHKIVKTYYSLGYLPLSGLINDHVSPFKEVGQYYCVIETHTHTLHTNIYHTHMHNRHTHIHKQHKHHTHIHTHIHTIHAHYIHAYIANTTHTNTQHTHIHTCTCAHTGPPLSTTKRAAQFWTACMCWVRH